jgi:hypothetical protein
LSNALPANSPSQAALFRPLLDDALAHESVIEWHASAFGLAVKLPDSRAKAWDTQLRRAVATWKLGNPVDRGAAGWDLNKNGANLRFSRADNWVAVSIGSAVGVESNVLTHARHPASKGIGAWLEGDVNLSQWKGRLSVLDGFNNLPTAHFSMSNRADFVRAFVQLDFPKPHQWKTEPWQMPTNAIWDPLMDFTVARGIGGVLEGLPAFRNLGWKPTPSQVCGWGVRDFPFQLNYAFPAHDVSRQLKAIEPKLSAEVRRIAGGDFAGSLALTTNQAEVIWRGLPLAVPNLGQVKTTNGEFALISFFPIPHLKERPPQELFAQIARNDLVLYDWESTPHRMNTWRQFYQIGEIGSRRSLTPTNALDQRWQSDIMPLLRDAVTEMHASSPTQMTLVRKSSIGLTSFELVTLSRWLESAEFPAFGVYPPKTPPKAAKPGARRQ